MTSWPIKNHGNNSSVLKPNLMHTCYWKWKPERSIGSHCCWITYNKHKAHKDIDLTNTGQCADSTYVIIPLRKIYNDKEMINQISTVVIDVKEDYGMMV